MHFTSSQRHAIRKYGIFTHEIRQKRLRPAAMEMPVRTDLHAVSIITDLLSVWQLEKTNLPDSWAPLLQRLKYTIIFDYLPFRTISHVKALLYTEELNKDTFEQSGCWRVFVQYIQIKEKQSKMTILFYVAISEDYRHILYQNILKL